MAEKDPITTIINTDTYPLYDPCWLEASTAIKELTDRFRDEGVLVLPDFIRADALANMVATAERWAEGAFFKRVEGNCYLEKRDADRELPATHPRNREDWTRLGVVAYDQIPEDSLIRQVYESPYVRRFVETIYNKGKLHNYNCPLGAMNIAVMEDGDYLRWHFDLSDFVVSIPLQHPESGGAFEYVHNLRSADDENYEGVARILDGDRSSVDVLDTPEGSLILFQGRYTIHRVSPIVGKRLRLGALLGYVDDPSKGGSDHLRMMRYGRTC